MFDFRKSVAALAVLASVGGALGTAPLPAAAQSTLKAVMNSDLKILDPIWTTAYVQRGFGYMVWDTLFSVDDKFAVKPQMVDKWDVSADKLTWTFTLRDGLVWSNGTPVTSEDCIASIKRWGARDSMGQKMMASVAGVEWIWIPDAQTQVSALQNGEIDMIESPSMDLLPLIAKDKNLRLFDYNPLGNQYAFRFNTLFKPFDNPKIRYAASVAMGQE